MSIEDNKLKSNNLVVYKRALENLEDLKTIVNDLNYGDNSVLSTGLYKFFTISFKVFHLQRFTKIIFEVLKLIAGEQVNLLYIQLVEESLSKKFVFHGKMVDFSHDELKEVWVSSEVPDTNYNWLGETGTIVLAYMISESVLKKLIDVCECYYSEMNENILNELAYTELSVIFQPR